MFTIKELVVTSKCRTGKASGTTKRGAYWLACEPIRLRSCGGDGVGNAAPSVDFELFLRHYRSGEVQASICRDAWHQNGSYSGGGERWESFPQILECGTVEELIVVLKAVRFGEDDWNEAVYSDRQEQAVTEAMIALGLPVAAPAPDEVAQ